MCYFKFKYSSTTSNDMNNNMILANALAVLLEGEIAVNELLARCELFLIIIEELLLLLVLNLYTIHIQVIYLDFFF